METKFTKGKQKSLNQYINEKHSQEECIGFIDGYEKALKDSKAPEMFEMIQELLKELSYHGYNNSTTIYNAQQLLKEATEL